MKPFLAERANCVCGEITLPGDKSIAHRYVIAGALCRGKTVIRNFPTNKDCLYTLNAFKRLGIKILRKHRPFGLEIIVCGRGLYGLKRPKAPIFVGDSGTTFRLLLGILAGQDFDTKLTAAKSLSNRPMLRVTAPLRMMGAKIDARTVSKSCKDIEEYPPVTIRGGNLKRIEYELPVASAQVKSAVLFAGLFIKGKSCVIEPVATRDHTERILRLFKADIKVKNNRIFVAGRKPLVSPKELYVPADISSAAFFMVLATLLPNSRVLIKNVSLNPSRAGIIRVLKRMGADIAVKSLQFTVNGVGGGEPMGDLTVKSSGLKGVVIKHNEVPSLIDELPVLMVAASNACGKTVFEGVGELRVKETDRIESLTSNLKKMGADIAVFKQGGSENIIIHGGKGLKGAKVKSFGDHRTAMSMVVAGLCAAGKTRIDDVSCVNKSFPGFLRVLKGIIH